MKTANDVEEVSAFPAQVAEGEVAPPLSPRLFGDSTNRYSGNFPHTRVVAFVSSFCDAEGADEADLERIRAEVRGLGATLLVLSPKGSWCFGPDDRLFRRLAPGDGHDESAAFRRFGVPEHDSRDGLRAVFVIDGAEIVRFAHVKGAPAPTSPATGRPSKDSLLRALVIAADAMERALKTSQRPSPAEAMTVGLITGFKQATASQPRTRVAAQTTPLPLPW